MKAAVVSTFTEPPRYDDIAEPDLAPGEELVEVVAAGLHPRVRSQASGSHYTSTDELPLIPGVDGVGRRADGSLVYFVLPDTAFGSMAERTAIDPRRSVALPGDVDPVLVAAAMNPAMSSWIALRRRISFQPGQSVLILGATGSAGRMAIQVAKRLGATSIVAAGRGAARVEALRGLGATATVDLGADPATVAAALSSQAAEVDVVLDYLWGDPASSAMRPILTARQDPGRLLQWIQIGSVAGPDITLSSALLRQANLHLLGSGQGSASARAIVAELPSLVDELRRGTLPVDAVAVPLADVTRAWTQPSGPSSQRIVLVP